MKLCKICHKISATDEDHLDCIQKRSIETESEDFKNGLPEKLNLSNNNHELSVEIRAILEHISKNKNSDE
ncbi:MAG: hypothetical protein OEW78_01655 [Nitrosopumilus sp.]|uniref:hypothetical protein n=1 Tax=Nitrosopumilus sp. TaxID=2024843 RepID=UPI00246E4E54|nr:hypothetical protein [Nitrosopumilus sp.]MDH5430575.1 hypothetical protein [Nitrosopumilus sp.]MDH5665156.1 hypothetical protein [Nitrosopumilus sp.]